MNKSYRVVITGPESTAKSTLSKQLAEHFDGFFYPEYAREYLVGKGAGYDFLDIENIVRGQIEQYKQSLNHSSKIIFFDTWLIITKVWFDWVFQKYPDWLEKEIENYPIDLYLLCLPDIPWEPDPLRENGGEERIRLFNAYKNELIVRKANFIEIGGEGKLRLENAIRAVNTVRSEKFV